MPHRMHEVGTGQPWCLLLVVLVVLLLMLRPKAVTRHAPAGAVAVTAAVLQQQHE